MSVDGTFTTYMHEVEAYWYEHKNLPKMAIIKTDDGVQWPLSVDNYDDFQRGAAIIRRLYKLDGAAGVLIFSDLLIFTHQYAYDMLHAAIRAKDWHAARAWLRPGIAYEPSTYNRCEKIHPIELGSTVRKGRADALRENFWCLRHTLLTNRLIARQRLSKGAFELDQLIKRYPLQEIDLSDDFFGDGTVLDVWMKYIHPHLLSLSSEETTPSSSMLSMKEYETELRLKSPMLSEYRRVIAEGLHSRLGDSSYIGFMPSDLVRKIAHM